MPGISDLQKAVNDIDEDIKAKQAEIGILRLARERLVDSEKKRKRRSAKPKTDKDPSQADS